MFLQENDGGSFAKERGMIYVRELGELAALLVALWLIADAAVRHLENVAYPSDYGHIPTELLSKGNLGNWQVGPSFNEPSDYASLFEQAWHVG